MTFWKWSKTAANNGTADSTCPFPEGMAPSALNDGTRGMMAAAAKFRDDTSGALITGGTSTAYTVSSNQVFTSKALMDGAEIALTIHATNGPAPTLNVDSLGADPIIIDTASSGTPVPSATLLTGGVYTLVYYNSGNTWRLKDFYQLPFTVPIGGLVDFIGSAVPSSNFVFPIGQAISRTTYATLFSLVGTTYGTGDGSTTFNVPDFTGRVVAMKEASATRLTSSYFGGNSTSLGAVGGSESHTLTLAQTPAGITSGGNNSISVFGNPGNLVTATGLSSSNAGAGSHGGIDGVGFSSGVSSSGTNSIAVTSTNTGGQAHNNVQPTIIANKLLRII
ncbi:tail fiber protein [Bradyrhizobium sp. 61]|uniref:phage tail protein n=2 Tax=unclassified Bradyrhizobium TaxID=2631580 RepID=UPI001FF83880|nr:tail fiber protein [Bradyrhizobium sp. 61]MCK1275584.1 tail fiber protein [Bradyrhizobium sp. 61]